jgi:hypothetical protein
VEKKRVIQHLIEFIEEELKQETSAPLKAPSERRSELETQLTMYRFIPSRTYAESDPIIPSSLVGLKIGDSVSFAFIVPRGGGFITQVEGVPLQILTAQSPLGEALLGRKTGDRISVDIRGQKREYLIVSSG